MKRHSFLSGCVRAGVATGFWFAGRQMASAQMNAAAPTNAPPSAPRPSGAQAPSPDWANLRRYRQENAQLAPPAEGEDRVVFMGDSITDAWGRRYHGFFPAKPYVNRGISGQTTPQMLVRFRPDVIALKPKVVVILAGTNDLAGNTGPMTPEEVLGNLISMAELAKASGIRVVLASVLPAIDYPWRPEHPNPSERIIALNAMIKDYATKNGLVYLDYFSALADEKNGLKKEYAQDAVHPNQAGYDVMGPLAEKAIQQALQGR
jgi:lysophospholipase L1-like esterase